MNVRESAVAGLFYSADSQQLGQDVTGLLAAAEPPPTPAPKAIIVPHAGYVYSGPVAATAYRLLDPRRETVRRVIILGPAHRVFVEGLALPDADGFETPLGIVPLDHAAAAEISTLPGVVTSNAAHRDEHCLEVQLPFLQTALQQFSLVPIVVGRCDPPVVAAALDALWGGPESLIVISSDLSHYLPYDEAQRTDAETCRQILGKTTSLDGHQACGANAVKRPDGDRALSRPRRRCAGRA